MKQATKAWLISGGILVFAGILILAGSLMKNHWDFKSLGNVKFETRTEDIDDDFSRIVINSDTEEITFLPSGDGRSHVVFHESEKEEYRASVDSGTLTIEAEDSGKWYDHVSFLSFDSPSITVYLPKREYAALHIEEDTGSITLPADFTFADLYIDASTGDVACSAGAQDMYIHLSTGDIQVEDTTAGKLDLSVSTGHVTLEHVTCRGDLKLHVSTGKAKLKDVSCQSLNSDGSTGDIELTNVIAAGMIQIERSTGDVELDRCDAGELLIETDTGDVTGSLLSSKVFITQSDTGRIDVPETTTGGKCKITTDTGDIKIKIE